MAHFVKKEGKKSSNNHYTNVFSYIFKAYFGHSLIFNKWRKVMNDKGDF